MKTKHFLLAAAVVAMTTAATADDGIWTISTPQADGKYPLRRDAAYQDDIITTHTRQARIRDDSHMGTVAGRYRGSPGVFSYGRRLYQAETNDRNPTAGFFRANGYAEFGVSGSKYRDNIFAYLIDSEANGKGEKSIMIVNQGKLSDTMPQSGEAAYLGDAFIGRHDDVTTGSARFTADFANKTLRGRIEPRERTITRDNANGRRIDAHSGATRHSGSSDYTISYATVNIDARIEGNGFTGGDQQPVRSKGHFYGANAAELGGIFHDTIQEVSGSFGAVKEGSRALPPAPTPQPKPSVIDTDNAGLWRISTTAADAARLPSAARRAARRHHPHRPRHTAHRQPRTDEHPRRAQRTKSGCLPLRRPHLLDGDGQPDRHRAKQRIQRLRHRRRPLPLHPLRLPH